MSPQLYKVAVTEYIATGLDFNHWKSKPFLALMTYVQLERAYGWTAFKQVFAKYRALPAEQRPQNDQQKIDMWMTMFSKTVGEDLSSFFLSWGHPVTDEARNSISDLPGSGLSMSDLLND
ncbi:unnamed protein product [Allacma fusca]|uniref:Peptidase M60 domain-containing protein n=1 Tax=Allacma fusca TaxID=39272 RepID=A0A8J2P3Y4_9HEXA|nr:unnamed protein product [Allacma fusca]